MYMQVSKSFSAPIVNSVCLFAENKRVSWISNSLIPRCVDRGGWFLGSKPLRRAFV